MAKQAGPKAHLEVGPAQTNRGIRLVDELQFLHLDLVQLTSPLKF